MPFTFSHIALALPFKNKRFLSPTGLIIGSIVPDFEFYFQLKEGTEIAHTLTGIFVFDFPLALALCFVFHLILRDPLLINLPGFLKGRFERYVGFSWLNYLSKNKLKVLTSILLGCSAHVFVDSFTHQDSLTCQVLPFLTHNAPIIGMPYTDLLQLALSAAGLIYIAWDIYTTPQSVTPSSNSADITSFWLVFSITASAILFARLFLFPSLNSFWGVVIAFIGSASYAWILTSINYLIVSHKNKISC